MIPGAQTQQDLTVTNLAMHGRDLSGRDKEDQEESSTEPFPWTVEEDYFAVDTPYVSRKLRLICFPSSTGLVHQIQPHEPVQPIIELNAGPVYIPAWPLTTYILVARYMLGVKSGSAQRFLMTPVVLYGLFQEIS